MAEQVGPATGAPRRWQPVTSETPLTRIVLTGVVLAFLGLFLVLPLAAVFVEALRKGGAAYLASFQDPDALAAIRLTLMVAAIAVPLNLVFGIAAAWAIAKFDFPGKSVLITLSTCPSQSRRSSRGWSTCCCSGRRACSALGCSATASRSSSPFPGLCWRRSSSPSPSLRAS